MLSNNMIGRRVIVTKVDQDDRRSGLRGDDVAYIVGSMNSMYTIQRIKDDRRYVVSTDQVREF